MDASSSVLEGSPRVARVHHCEKESHRLFTIENSAGEASHAAMPDSQGVRWGSSMLLTRRAALSATPMAAASPYQQTLHCSAMRVVTKRQRLSLQGQAQ
jgi:hypothetical protein